MTDLEPDLRRLFEVWINSERKARIVVFFHQNPGLIETLEGLARRLGTTVEALAEDVRDHITLGLLTERVLGEKRVLMYDSSRRGDIEEMIITLAREQEKQL